MVYDTVPFCGKVIETTVTDKTSIVENWVFSISSKFMLDGQKVIARLNCKWKSYPIRSTSSKIATLLLYINDMPQTIKSFLSDANVIFVGIEIEETLFKLQNEYGLCCTNLKNMDSRFLDVEQVEFACIDAYALHKIGHKLLKM